MSEHRVSAVPVIASEGRVNVVVVTCSVPGRTAAGPGHGGRGDRGGVAGIPQRS